MLVVLDDSYVKPYICSITEGCRFTSKDIWKLKRHEKTCTKETKISYRQKIFGNQEDIRSRLIKLKIIDPNDSSHKRFATFDIGEKKIIFSHFVTQI